MMPRACISWPLMKTLSQKRTRIKLWGSAPCPLSSSHLTPLCEQVGREVFRYTSHFPLPVIRVPILVGWIFALGGTRVSPAPRRKWVQGCRFWSGNWSAAKPHLCGCNLGVREPCQHRHHRHATPSYLTTELAWHQDAGLLPSGSLHTPCVIPTSSLQRQRLGAKSKSFPIWIAFHCLSMEASRREVKL